MRYRRPDPCKENNDARMKKFLCPSRSHYLNTFYDIVPPLPPNPGNTDPAIVGSVGDNRDGGGIGVAPGDIDLGGTGIGVTPYGSPPLASPMLWLYSDFSTYQSAGGSAATADTDPVGEWQDLSGNTRHVTELTNKPILKLNQINGHPSVRFDGTNDKLKALFTLNSPFTIFMVINQISWTAGDHFIGGGAGDFLSVAQRTATPKFSITWLGTGGGGATDDSNLAVGTWGIVEINVNGGANFVKVNNNAATTTNIAETGDKGGLTLAAHPNPSSFGNVEFAHLLLYGSSLSGANSTTVRNYLNGIYAIF